MRYLALWENPWCLLGALLLIVLLLVAAALLSRSRAIERAALRPEPSRSRATQRLSPRPEPFRSRDITASAPFEALAALRERLLDLQRHLPPGSEDARWLASYLHDLHNVMDDLYWGLYQTQGSERAALLEQVSLEVARLDRVISAHLTTTIGETTDRTALHAQLDRLRRALNDA